MSPAVPLPIDLTFGRFVQLYQPDWLTWLMKAVSWLLAPELWAAVGLALVVWLAVRRQGRAAWLLFALAAGNILSVVVKFAVARPRPTADQLRVLVHETGYSFPSGHAVGVVLLAAAVAFFYRPATAAGRRWLVTGLIFLSLLVGWSRLYLGVHWLTDIVAGYIIGGLWAVLCWLAIVKHRPEKSELSNQDRV